MDRLPKGAEPSTTMAFLMMCVEKILRLLRLGLVAIKEWLCADQTLGWLLLALKSIGRLETTISLGAA